MARPGKRQAAPVDREEHDRSSVELRMSTKLIEDVDAIVARVGSTRSGFFALAAAKLVTELGNLAGPKTAKRYEKLAAAIEDIA